MSDCPTCGDAFGAERAMKIHHAKAHGESLNERECPNCGEEFTARVLHTGKRKRHCSAACEQATRFDRRFTEAQRRRLRQLYVGQELSIAAVADHVDLSYSAVYRRLIAAGFHDPDPANTQPWTLADESNHQPPDAFVAAGIHGGGD